MLVKIKMSRLTAEEHEAGRRTKNLKSNTWGRTPRGSPSLPHLRHSPPSSPHLLEKREGAALPLRLSSDVWSTCVCPAAHWEVTPLCRGDKSQTCPRICIQGWDTVRDRLPICPRPNPRSNKYQLVSFTVSVHIALLASSVASLFVSDLQTVTHKTDTLTSPQTGTRCQIIQTNRDEIQMLITPFQFLFLVKTSINQR